MTGHNSAEVEMRLSVLGLANRLHINCGTFHGTEISEIPHLYFYNNKNNNNIVIILLGIRY
jgi:hypothetical protein